MIKVSKCHRDLTNVRRRSCPRRERRWGEDGKHLLLTSLFVPKRESRYKMLTLKILMSKRGSRLSSLTRYKKAQSRREREI